MARIPMVTRTFLTTKANVFCADKETEQTFKMDVTLPKTYKSDKELMKAIEKQVNTDKIKAIYVVYSEVQEILYGMSEQDFINSAQVLPPRKATNNK